MIGKPIMSQTKMITLQQTASAIGRPAEQRQTLVGLGLNKIGRRSAVLDTPAARGMNAKDAHLVRVLDGM